MGKRGLNFFFRRAFGSFGSTASIVGRRGLRCLGLGVGIHGSNGEPGLFAVRSLRGSTMPVRLECTSSNVRASTPLITVIRCFTRRFSFGSTFRHSMLGCLCGRSLLAGFAPKVGQGGLKGCIRVRVRRIRLDLTPRSRETFVDGLMRRMFRGGGGSHGLKLVMSARDPCVIGRLGMLLHTKCFRGTERGCPFLRGSSVTMCHMGRKGVVSLVTASGSAKRCMVGTLSVSSAVREVFRRCRDVRRWKVGDALVSFFWGDTVLALDPSVVGRLDEGGSRVGGSTGGEY